jgi:predicted neuraminidase
VLPWDSNFSKDYYNILHVDVKNFSVTVTIRCLADHQVWRVTGVYGRQGDSAKLQFLQELGEIGQNSNAKWLVMDDFNLIYRACDKNNGRINRRLLNNFRNALNVLQLKEIDDSLGRMHFKLYTDEDRSCLHDTRMGTS